MASHSKPDNIDSLCHQVDYSPGALCSVANTEYGYVLRMPPNAVFVALFALLLVAHLGLLIRFWKTSKYMLLATICATLEMGGWAARVSSVNNPFVFGGYVAQLVLLIISPVFASAATYVIFCRAMDILGHEYSRIPRKWYIITFVVSDVICLVVQAAGGGISATADTPSGSSTGKSVMIAGVALQVVVTSIFVALFTNYVVKWNKLGRAPLSSKNIKLVILAIAIATGAIFIRCIFRLAEMSQGWKGFLATHEGYLVGFDGVPLTIALLVLAVFHPGHFLDNKYNIGAVKATPRYDVESFETEAKQSVRQ